MAKKTLELKHEHDEPWGLPDNWVWKTLNDTGRIFAGSPAPQGIKFFEGGTLSFVRTQDVGREKRTTELVNTVDHINQKAIDECSLVKASKGTILFPKSGAAILTNNRAILGVDAYIVSHLAALTVYPNDWDKKYVYYWLCKVDMAKYLNNIAYPSLSLATIKGIPVPDPGKIDIQHHIVARIESLLSEINEARKLLDKMRKDAEGVLDASTNEIFANVGCIPLETIVESYKNGIYKPKEYYGEGYPSIRMFNIQNGRVNSEGAPLLKVTSQELELYGLVPDDILVNRVNSRELVGKSGLVPSSLGPCTFESKNIRVRLKRNKADPSFVVFGLNSRIVKEQILRMQKPAIGQATVNQTNLNNLKIPFISDLKKQREIANRLRSIREEIEHLKSSFARDAHLLDQLEQSILERAFRGEL